MKILVVSLYYAPDQCQGNGPIVRALCDDWAAAGHEVTVITSFPHYNCDEVWPEYRGKWFERDHLGKVEILRTYLYVTIQNSRFGRLLSYLSFNFSSTWAGLWTQKPDVIFAMSPPLTIGLTAWLIGKLKNVPYCYNVQDIWPEAAVRLGMLQGERVIHWWERVERFIYRHSRKVFVISEEFRDNLLGKQVEPTKLEVIPNFVDTKNLRPLPRRNALAAMYGLQDKFVVLYAGNVGLSQGLEVVLDAAERLQARREIEFLIVGAGTSKNDLLADAQRRGLSNVRFLPLFPEAQVPELYASCDVALIPLRRGLTQNSVPCKTYSIMASGRPYIASVDEGSNVWKLTEKVECGVCIPPENAEALAEAVLALQTQSHQAAAMGAHGRAYVESHFARANVTQQYRVALEQIVNPHASEARKTVAAARAPHSPAINVKVE
jgi:colanic acid biosynthesis glycosyl transferase WcaI